MSVSVLVWVFATNKSQQSVGNNTCDSSGELEDFMYHDYSSALKKSTESKYATGWMKTAGQS